MTISLTRKYLDELRKGVNTPNVIVEIDLDSGTRRFGYHNRNRPGVGYHADGAHLADAAVFAVGSDELTGVEAALKSISSLQNKLDTKTGFSTRGQLAVVLSGRDNFIRLVRDEYLKNRRVRRLDGFLSPGFTIVDYAVTFNGRITDWSRRGDELTLTISDDLADGSRKIPVENQAKTQFMEFRNMNPVDIISDILINRLGIDTSFVDTDKFAAERDLWLAGWRFDRTITEPREANEYLNELQIETNSFILHDGRKTSYKVFAPAVPGQRVEEWTDDGPILSGSLIQRSGYRDSFYNRVVVYFDYDESGGDREESYEAAVIAADASSQDASQWNEARTRVIKSRWIRTRTFTATSNITGVRLYHLSRSNGLGTGILTYDRAGNSLRWAAPGGAAGDPIRLSKSGKFVVSDSDMGKYVRVIVDEAALPSSSQADTVVVTALAGENYAAALATKLLNRFRDPSASITFDVDMNNAAFGSQFVKPGDLKDITTGEACEKGDATWTGKRVMLTSVRPDFSAHKVAIEAVEAKMHRRYAFVGPAGLADYPMATDSQRGYAYAGDAANRVGNGSAEGYYSW